MKMGSKEHFISELLTFGEQLYDRHNVKFDYECDDGGLLWYSYKTSGYEFWFNYGEYFFIMKREDKVHVG